MNASIIQFKPKRSGQSDKYSWQLFIFLLKNRNRFDGLPKVYYCQTQNKYMPGEEVFNTFEEVPFDKNDFNPRYIYIGCKREGWYSAGRLSSILGCSAEKYTVWAINWLENMTVIDITDWFWPEYLKVGRCIWDRSHDGWLADDDERFTQINRNSRRCNWCGKHLHRKIEKRVKLERKEIWEAV